MKRGLDKFDVLILHAVNQQKESYGVSVKLGLEAQLKKRVSLGSVLSALKHLEQNGLLTSVFGEATSKRGGNRKRIYLPTVRAHHTLAEIG